MLDLRKVTVKEREDNKVHYRLKMSMTEYQKLRNELADRVFGLTGVPWQLYGGSDLETGSVHYKPETGQPEYVAIQQNMIFEPCLNSAFGPAIVSDEDVFDMIDTIYHENQHCYQMISLMQKYPVPDGAISRELALSSLAHLDNETYYNAFLWDQVLERDAECAGLQRTYMYAKSFIGRNGLSADDIDDMMVSYVNWRCSKHPTYSARKEDGSVFTCMQEVRTMLGEIRCIDKPMTDLNRSKYTVNYYTGIRLTDPALIAFVVNKNLEKAYLNCETLSESNRLIAAINVRLHPEYQSRYASLRDEDLSLSKDCQLTDEQVAYILKASKENKIAQREEDIAKAQAEYDRLTGKFSTQTSNQNKILSRLEDLQTRFGSVIEKTLFHDDSDDDYEIRG